MGALEHRLIEGMLAKGYSRRFAEQIFNQIQGFGEYGFPESHSASFALLVYVSAWLKCHEPAAFFCALLNSQPMGFYAPAQLVRAARKQHVEILSVDVNRSIWQSSLEASDLGRPAIRLGLRLVKGLSLDGVECLVAARSTGAFTDVGDVASRTGLDKGDLGALAASGALKSLASNRHRARWEVAGVDRGMPLLGAASIAEGIPMLRRPTEGEDIVADYGSLGLSLERHPLALLRRRFERQQVMTAAEVHAAVDGALVHAAGLVIARQRPSSAAGVTFVTLEDETGYLNLIVWERIAQRQRQVLLGARLLGVKGRVQREDEVLHLIAEALTDYSALLGRLVTGSRDFH
jgi:error-prone DNA polymerase